MPSKKKKYNARFPAGRIKKIMQTDEEVGKVAKAVPIIISKTLEMFVHSLLTKTMQITSAKNARTLTPSHMKQCILSESRFDFLKDLVKNLPDVSSPDEEVPTPPLTPAPAVSQSHSFSRATESEAPKEMGSSIVEPNHLCRPLNNDGSTINMMQKMGQNVKPEFQITIPDAYGVIQPNFYTEMKPANPSLSNFTHSSNIDEDYDT